MKSCFCRSRILMLGACLWMSTTSATAAILLNEVMANPLGSEYTDEYIELRSTDSLSQSLEGWRIGDGGGEDVLQAWSGTNMNLPAGGLALILDPGYAGSFDSLITAGTLFLTVPDGALCSAGLSNSTAERVVLMDAAGMEQDAVLTRPDLEAGCSLERRGDEAMCEACWLPVRVSGGSPGSPNTVRRQSMELQAVPGVAGIRLLATGSEGFRGRLRCNIGRSPCLNEQITILEDMATGEEVVVDWPAWPLPGWNPFQLTSLPAQGEEMSLLDTLIWRPLGFPEIYIEAVQPQGEDWVQVALADSCPCLLDGFSLRSRSFNRVLAGWLTPAGRLLLGQGIVADCPPAMRDSHELSLAVAGGLELLGADGLAVDVALWPEQAQRDHWPWRRLDPAQAGDRESNWIPGMDFRPGCVAPSLPHPEEPGGNWWLNRHRLVPGSPDDGLLVIHAPDGLVGDWSLELWNLEGALLLRRSIHTNRFIWDGRDDSGRFLPQALYLLRLTGAGHEQLVPLGITHPE